jgi:hypothetical protein
MYFSLGVEKILGFGFTSRGKEASWVKHQTHTKNTDRIRYTRRLCLFHGIVRGNPGLRLLIHNGTHQALWVEHKEEEDNDDKREEETEKILVDSSAREMFRLHKGETCK